MTSFSIPLAMRMGHINDFSPEIVREIFLRSPSPDSAAPSTRSAPLNIAAVCKSWRRLALKTPEIWTILEIRLVRGFMPDAVAIISHWAKLANPRLLSLTYNFPDSYLGHIDILNTSVLPAIYRVQHLTLRIEAPYQLGFLHNIPRDTGLPFLESLTLASHDTCALWLGGQKVPVLCPRLRRLSIEAIPPLGRKLDAFLASGHSTLNVPWTQLTSLKIVETRLFSSRVVEILVQCTNLVECELETGYSDRTAIPMNPPVVLWHLTSLILTAKRRYQNDLTGGATPILDSLTLPGLKTLGVSAGLTSAHALSGSLLSLQQRSQFSSLEKLSLTGNIDVEGLTMLFSGLPTLKSLFLHPFNQLACVFLLHVLTDVPETRMTLLPHLDSLDITVHAFGVYVDTSGNFKYQPPGRAQAMPQYDDVVKARSGALISMLRSRFQRVDTMAIPSVAQLEHVALRTLRGWKNLDPEKWEWEGQGWFDDASRLQVEELQREGLVVEFPFQVLDGNGPSINIRR